MVGPSQQLISTRAALLISLLPGEGYGLALIDQIKKKTMGRVTLRQGSVYPVLQEMESDGLVKRWVEAEGLGRATGRPRRYYELTAKGRKEALGLSRALRALLGYFVF